MIDIASVFRYWHWSSRPRWSWRSSAPAGALATVRPHASGRPLAPGAEVILDRPHVDSPLPISLAKITVTDLSTNNATEDEYDNPAPVYPSDINCNTGTTDLLCMQYGDGPGANGGSFNDGPSGSGRCRSDVFRHHDGLGRQHDVRIWNVLQR